MPSLLLGRFGKGRSRQAVADSGSGGKDELLLTAELADPAPPEQAPTDAPRGASLHSLPPELLQQVFRHLEGGSRKHQFAV